MNAYIEVPESGEPRIAGSRIPVLRVALEIGDGDVTVEGYADEHGMDEEDVEAALAWASNHEEQMDEAIRRRAESMEEMSDREYPEFVAGPGDADVEGYQRRARRALAEVVKDWRMYGDTRWGGEE